jgi:FPC/CPF motif-containing protein YcgG
MERLFLRRGEVASRHAVSSWQSVMFSEFEAQMSSEARPFPCVFGVAGHRQDQLRYLFLDPYDVDVLGGQLAQYVSESRSCGPNTSLIVFTRPRPVQTLDAYYRKMWLTLDQLARLDKSPWPAEIPEQIDHPMWEFSFAGEPIFVVCTTPAHVMRQSRRSSAFMLTFQPRWVFEKILGTEKAANAAFAEVRKRLIPYDSASPSPHLGRYGTSDGREYQQYFLHDDNNAGGGCPFAKLAQSKASPIEDKEQAA